MVSEFQNIEGVMTSNPQTLRPKDTLTTANRIFEEMNFHHIPVTDENGILLGMVTREAVRACQSPLYFTGNPQEKRRSLQLMDSILLEDIMERNPVMMKPGESVSKAILLFKENRFDSLPVVDDNKKLLGILTPYDLLMKA